MAEAGRFPHAASTALAGGTVLEVEPIERLVFWQGVAATYQWPALKALALNFGYDITLVTMGQTESQARANLGWPNLEEARVFLCAEPDEQAIDMLLKLRQTRTVHVFSGALEDQKMSDVFEKAAEGEAKLALMVEPPQPNNVPAMLRSATPQALRKKWGHRVDHVFAVGRMAAEWATSVGFESDKIVPWGYFPASPEALPDRESPNDAFRMAFVGPLNSSKGPDVLFDALRNVKNRRWTLTCIGEGHLMGQCQRIAVEHGFASQVEFRTNGTYLEDMKELAMADLAVVPSRFDAWGPAVNEALMRGVPVVCTNKCGASELIKNPQRGLVVSAEDPRALSQAIDHFLAKGPIHNMQRRTIAQWAKAITGEAGAGVFHNRVNPQDRVEQSPLWYAA